MPIASQSHAAHLFKTIVVAGASLGMGACGGESRRTVDSNDSGSSGGSDSGGTGGRVGMGGTSAASGAGGTGVAGGGSSIEPCSTPAQLACSCPVYSECSPSSVPSGTPITCTCDPSRPAAPEDCAHTEQFTCASYSPAFESCRCDPTAPLSDADCERPLRFGCYGRNPWVGCSCMVPIK